MSNNQEPTSENVTGHTLSIGQGKLLFFIKDLSVLCEEMADTSDLERREALYNMALFVLRSCSFEEGLSYE